MGVPLIREDGTVFGTLCGFAFRAKPRSAARELTVVEAAARMLSTLMAAGWNRPGSRLHTSRDECVAAATRGVASARSSPGTIRAAWWGQVQRRGTRAAPVAGVSTRSGLRAARLPIDRRRRTTGW